MALRQDLEQRVDQIMAEAWSRRNGTVVPDDTSVKLGNDGVDLDAVVLYADLRGSTSMVDTSSAAFAAEIYKSFLYCAARIIASENGVVTAYDGDRIMAVYLGDRKNTRAVRSGLKINWAKKTLIQPRIQKQYPNSNFTLVHTVGIDASSLLVAKTGARGTNDLVWVGRAANHAAKLTELGPEPTFITAEVYKTIADEVKLSSGVNMWKAYTWNGQGGRQIYGSTYWWSLP